MEKKFLQPDAENLQVPRYDAILVNEGQDFRPLWWQTLRLALNPGGEMRLGADKTQNIDGTAAAWTEDTMTNAGFRGSWVEMKQSGSQQMELVAVPGQVALGASARA